MDHEGPDPKCLGRIGRNFLLDARILEQGTDEPRILLKWLLPRMVAGKAVQWPRMKGFGFGEPLVSDLRLRRLSARHHRRVTRSRVLRKAFNRTRQNVILESKIVHLNLTPLSPCSIPGRRHQRHCQRVDIGAKCNRFENRTRAGAAESIPFAFKVTSAG
jgi:hypothetical protein